MLFLPYTKYTIKTGLSPQEAEAWLMQITEKRKLRFGLSRNHKAFEGKVENGRFNINRIIHYRNSFLPVVIGDIKDDLDVTRIEITMRLHLAVLVVLVISLVVGITGTVMTLIGAGWMDILATGGVFVFILGFFYIITMAFFNYEVNKAKALLAEIWPEKTFL
ncbi:MAG: hypothetical protein Kow0080_06890 [Candidatus Promineifilaceae bacterium]